MKHAAGSSLYFREQKLNKIKYNRLHDWEFNSTGMFLKNQSDILCRSHCSQKNAVNYMPFILMCLNLLASCCLQQIFQLTVVVCRSGSNIVVFWASNTANACVLLLEFGFTTLASWKLKLHWILLMVATEFHLKEVFWDVPIRPRELFSAEMKSLN